MLTCPERVLTALWDSLPSDAPYHLAVVFATEANPGGGWWNKSGPHKAQSEEGVFLEWLGNQVRGLARDASTVRYFGVACGSNLPGQGVVRDIHDTLAS